jgi:hypothetical protein
VEPLPDDVDRFMQDHIETIDQLEILRVLGEDRQKAWDSTALAVEVQGEPQAIRAHLAAMHARGLLTMATREAGVSCRYGAGTPELETMVDRLLQVYKERPVTMIKMVYERAKDPLWAFAEAFRIRKEH